MFYNLLFKIGCIIGTDGICGWLPEMGTMTGCSFTQIASESAGKTTE